MSLCLFKHAVDKNYTSIDSESCSCHSSQDLLPCLAKKLILNKMLTMYFFKWAKPGLFLFIFVLFT